MLDYVTEIIEINNSFVRIKNYKKKLITNFFADYQKLELWIFKNELCKIEIGEVTFFLKSKSDFDTLFFIASSNEELDKSLSVLLIAVGEKTLVLDIVQREESSAVLNIFYGKSFKLYTSLVRMNRINYQFDSFSNFCTEVKKATTNHLIPLYNMLHSFFDDKAEQLPDQIELENLINNKNILIYEENTKIGGFLIYEIVGKTLFLKYWFVHPDFREKKIGSKLFSEFEKNGKNSTRQLFWVIRSNENAIKRYRHYGFSEENMYNFVITNKNINYEGENNKDSN